MTGQRWKRSMIADATVVRAAHLSASGSGRSTLQVLVALTGAPEKVCVAAMQRAADRGWIDYGVSIAWAFAPQRSLADVTPNGRLQSAWDRMTEQQRDDIRIAAHREPFAGHVHFAAEDRAVGLMQIIPGTFDGYRPDTKPWTTFVAPPAYVPTLPAVEIEPDVAPDITARQRLADAASGAHVQTLTPQMQHVRDWIVKAFSVPAAALGFTTDEGTAP